MTNGSTKRSANPTREPLGRPRLKIGEGYISGYLSILFGLISLGGVGCFLFPDYLTTPGVREQYPLDLLRGLLLGCLLFSFLFALLSLVLCRTKVLSLIGALTSATAILLGGAGVEIKQFDQPGFFISLDWLILDLLVLALIFIPLELFLPKRLRQSKLHSEWKTDLIYFAIGHLFVQVVAVAVQSPASYFFGGLPLGGLREWTAGLPFLVQLPMALALTDVFQWTIHRLFHAVPYLWRFHAVHHSIRAVDWLAGSRLHFVDIVVTRAFSYTPLYVLGFSTEVFYLYVVVVSLQAVMAHANTRIEFGPLKYLLVTPQYHHWHHSDDPEFFDKNFAIHFPLIDWIMGTYHLPGKEWPESMGLGGVKLPQGYLRQFAYPFFEDPSGASEEG
jgi:lathosterol oxidase